ncbi:hypothetical protein [Propionivibrio sp.]|uniref:hypothetical protein n=1 Tax=Propionivibrio sp. TaxID=2212460 RepID=UPI003BF25E51
MAASAEVDEGTLTSSKGIVAGSVASGKIGRISDLYFNGALYAICQPEHLSVLESSISSGQGNKWLVAFFVINFITLVIS